MKTYSGAPEWPGLPLSDQRGCCGCVLCAVVAACPCPCLVHRAASRCSSCSHHLGDFIILPFTSILEENLATRERVRSCGLYHNTCCACQKGHFQPHELPGRWLCTTRLHGVRAHWSSRRSCSLEQPKKLFFTPVPVPVHRPAASAALHCSLSPLCGTESVPEAMPCQLLN